MRRTVGSVASRGASACKLGSIQVEAATPFDGVVALPIGEATARGLSDGVLRHEVTNPYHFHDAGRLFVLEMLLNAFAIAA